MEAELKKMNRSVIRSILRRCRKLERSKDEPYREGNAARIIWLERISSGIKACAFIRHADLSLDRWDRFDFRYWLFDHVTFRDSRLVGTRFNNAQIFNTCFTGVNLTQTDWSNAVVVGSEFYCPRFTNARFTETHLYRNNLRNAVFSCICFDGAVLNSDFTGAVFRGCSFNRARLHGDFTDAKFRDCDLSNAVLSSGCFRDADMRGADFTNARWDYSSGFTLSCRGSHFKASADLLYQYLAHLCTLIPAEGEEKEFEEVQGAVRKYARRFRRYDELMVTELVR